MQSPSLPAPASNKRDASHTGSPDVERRKRGKYTQVACNECKRRKLKCSGGDVCSRCAANGISCIYALQSRPVAGEALPSVLEREPTRLESMEHRMNDMQRQIDSMSAQIRALQSVSGLPDSTPSDFGASNHTDGRWASRGRPASPSYVGPTSGEFGLAAVTGDANEDETDNSEDALASIPVSPRLRTQREVRGIPSNPILALSETDASKLLDIYEDAIGKMYPIVDLKSLRRYIVNYYRQHQNRSVETLNSPQIGDENWWFSVRDTEILKIVLAIALISESHGRSDLGDVLAASVENTFATTRTQVPEVDMKELTILVLVALYHSLRDDDVLAWRTIGMAALGALQLGLHRWDTWLRTGGIFPGDLERSRAINLFWCLYVFDKEFSFETGLPFSLRDTEMDANLPEPVGYNPHLTCMISYCRVGSNIWDLVVGWGSTAKAVAADNCAYLDFQIKQWQDSIPHEFRLKDHRGEWALSSDNEWLAISQVLFHMRANQLGILVYKQNLLNPQSIRNNIEGAKIAVQRAKDTIQTLERVSRVSALYSRRPEPFNRFLFSALATLFLAASHAPDIFTQPCRSDFYKALDTLKRTPTRGKYSRRLQKVIKNIKRINTKRRPNGKMDKNMYDPIARSKLSSNADPVSMTPPSPAGMENADYNTVPSTLMSSENFDLTDFFELAGDCFLEPQSTSYHHNDGNTGGGGNTGSNFPGEGEITADLGRHGTRSADFFQAEDETLTRLMVGLL